MCVDDDNTAPVVVAFVAVVLQSHMCGRNAPVHSSNYEPDAGHGCEVGGTMRLSGAVIKQRC